MKAMVIGGAGFIGSNLCEALVEEDHEVVCVDNLSLGRLDNIQHLLPDERKANDSPSQGKLNFEQVDIADQDIAEELIGRYRPDIVYHLAANSDIQASAGNPAIEYRNTYSTTFSLLQAMRKHQVKKLFFSSTSAVYGDKGDVLSGLCPISYYGAAKLGSEALISAYSYMNDIDAMVFRFPNVIGPRLTHGVIFDFIKKLHADNTQLEILGNGKQTKPYIYVADLVRAIMWFTDSIPKGMSLYNIGVEGETSVDRIAEIICEELGLAGVAFRYTGGETGWKGDVPRFRYCLDKVHKAGWRAEYSSDEAVRMTVQSSIGKGI